METIFTFIKIQLSNDLFAMSLTVFLAVALGLVVSIGTKNFLAKRKAKKIHQKLTNLQRPDIARQGTARRGSAASLLIAAFILCATFSYNLPEKYQLANLINFNNVETRHRLVSETENVNAQSDNTDKTKQCDTKTKQCLVSTGVLGETDPPSLLLELRRGEDRLRPEDSGLRRGEAKPIQLGQLLLTKNNELFIVSHSIISDSIKRHTIKNINLANNSITSRTIKDHTIKSQDLNQHLEIEHLSIKNELTVEDAINAEELNTETIDLGENTITDQNFSGNWNFNGGNLTTTGTLTIGAINSNGTINGNTITTGTGTLTLNAYTLTLSGNTQLNQNLKTTDTPTFNNLFLTTPGNTTTSVVTIDGIQTLTGKTLSANANTITALTNANLSGTAGITNANLQYSTISGIPLGTNLATLSFGTHLTGTSYNGATNVTIATDATDANTVSTIVARDASGNFQANTITASIIGASSLNVLKSGDTMTGNLNLGANTLTTTNTTLITNLNADLLDNQHGSYYAPLSSITGTQNYIAKFTATNSVGSSNVYADGVNVGIGTAAPTQIFQINSSAEAAFVVTSAGNVGIGTTGPTSLLTVSGGNIALDVNQSVRYSSYYIFGGSSYLGFQSGGVTKIVMNSNGNVGIGTTSPSKKLDVAGDINLTGGIYFPSYLEFYGAGVRAGNTTYGFLANRFGSPVGGGTVNFNDTVQSVNDERILRFVGDTDTYWSNPTANNMAWFTGGSEKMRIDSSGNVGIGTTSPGGKLSIQSATANKWIYLTTTAGNPEIESAAGLYLKSVNTYQYFSDSTHVSLQGVSSDTGFGTVNIISGNVGIGTTGPNTKLDVVGESIVEQSAGSYFMSLYPTGNNARLGFYSQTSFDIGTVTNYGGGAWSSKVTVLNSGNVGIGTTGPTAKLHVYGSQLIENAGVVSLTLNDSSNSQVPTIHFQQGGTTKASIKAGAGLGQRLDFFVGSTNVMSMGVGASSGVSVGSGYVNSAPPNGGGMIIEGNVGIGTTSPGAKMDIRYNIDTSSDWWSNSQAGLIIQNDNGAGGAVLKLNSGVGGRIIYGDASANSKLTFSSRESAGTVAESIVFDNNGNVGIGTTAPASKLNVIGTTGITWAANGTSSGLVTIGTQGASGGSLFVNTNSVNPEYGSGLAIDGTHSTLISTVNIKALGPNFATYGSNLTFSTTNGTSLNEAMRINKSGNVGIGTTAPGAKLDVTGNVYLTGSTGNNYIDFKPSGAQKAIVGMAGPIKGTASQDLALFAETGQAISFMSGGSGTDAMTIASTGNVGIGTTGPNYKLDVIGGAGTDMGTDSPTVFIGGPNYGSTGDGVRYGTLAFGSTSGSNTYISYGGQIQSYSSGGVNKSDLRFYTADGGSGSREVVRINKSGNVGIGTTGPTAKLEISSGANNAKLQLGNGDSYGTYVKTLAGSNAGNLYIAPASGITNFFDGTNAYQVSIYNGVSQNIQLNSNGNSWLNATTGNVGIGSTAPGARLQVVGADSLNTSFAANISGATGTGLVITNNGNVGIGNVAPGSRLVIKGANQLSTSSALNITDSADGSLVFVQNNGNVGIGTTGPVAKFQVTGVSSLNYSAIFGNNDFIKDVSGSDLLIDFGATTGNTYTRLSALSSGQGAWNNLVLQSGGGNVGIGNVAPGSRLVIKGANQLSTSSALNITDSADGSLVFVQNNGNVGIGTTGPGYKLDVNGDVNIAFGSNYKINTNSVLTQNSTQTIFGWVGRTDSGLVNNYLNPGSGTGAGLELVVNNAARLSVLGNGNITIPGNVGIGTTIPGQKLHIKDGTSGTFLGMSEDTVDWSMGMDDGSSLLDIKYEGTDFATFNSNGQVWLGMQGNVGIGTTNPTGTLEVKGQYVGFQSTDWGTASTGNRLRFQIPTNTSTYVELQSYKNGADGYGNLALQSLGGNVGIGTTSPGAKLQIGGASSDVHLILGDGTRDVIMQMNAGAAKSVMVLGGAGNLEIGSPAIANTSLTNSGNILLGSATDNGGGAKVQVTGGLTTNGNVGIGSTAPGARLQVVGADSLNTSFAANISGATGTGLVITNSGNVGIGTTSPGDKLMVKGSFYVEAAGDASERFSVDKAGLGIVQLNYGGGSTRVAGSGDLGARMNITSLTTGGVPLALTGVTSQTGNLFEVNSVGDLSGDRFVIQSSGNVGIGTTGPGAKLDVAGTARFGDYASNRNVVSVGGSNGDYGSVGYGVSYTNTPLVYNYLNSDYASLMYMGSGGFKFRTASTGISGNPITFTDAMTIQQSGNVGIGTTGPGTKLDVSGVIKTTSSLYVVHAPGTDYMNFEHPGQQSWRTRITTDNESSYIIGNDYSGGTFGNKILTLTNSGNVGIGTTTPGYKLDVQGGSINTSGNFLSAGVLTVSGTGDSSIAGNVGIGTTTPGARLDISPTITATTDLKGILSGLVYNGATAMTNYYGHYIAAPTGTGTITNKYALVTEATAGNVGIGTTGPASALDVRGQGIFGVSSGVGYATPLTKNGLEINLTSNSLITLGESVLSDGNPAVTLYRTSSGGRAGRAYRMYAPNNAGDLYFDISTGGATAYGSETWGTIMTLKTGGNVGIGTTGPTTKFEVSSGGADVTTIKASYNATNYLEFAHNRINAVSSGGNDYLALQTAGTERVRINVSGNVGIGNVAPGSRLVIKGANQLSTSSALNITDSADGSLVFVQNNGNVGIGTTAPGGALEVSGTTGNILGLRGSSGALRYTFGATGAVDISGATGSTMLSIANSGAGDFMNIGSGKLYVQNGGNVGIGTTSPGYKFVVSNTVAPRIVVDSAGTATTYSVMSFSEDSTLTNSAAIARYGSAYATTELRNALAITTESGNGDIRLTPNGTGRTLITSGNVGIGTTSPLGALHIYKGASGQATPYASSGLVLEDNVPTYLEFLSPSTQAASGVLWGDEAGTTIGSVLYDHTSNYMRFTTAGTEKVRIDTNGNVGIGNVAPGSRLVIKGANQLSTSSALNITDSADGSLVFVQNNGNVGIGTTNPGAKLHVVAGASQYAGTFQADQSTTDWVNTFSAFNLINTNATANNHAVFAFADNAGATSAGVGAKFIDRTNHYGDLYFYTKGTDGYNQRLYIQSSGNIGIGTTVPNAKLTIAKTTEGLGMLDLASDQQTAGNTSMIRFGEVTRMASDDDSRKGAIIYQSTGSWNRGDLIFALDNTADVSNVTVADAIMTLKSTGNVGIGTTGPGEKLEVANGNLLLSSATSNLYLANNAYGLGVSGGNLTLKGYSNLIISADEVANASYYLAFKTANSERVRITNEGNVGIGNVAPGSRLVIKGANQLSTSSALNITDSADGSLVFVQNNGNVGIGTTSPSGKLTIDNASAIVNVGDGSRNLVLRSTNANGADLGPQMSFSGAGGGASTPYAFATIAGRKEGATAYAGYLQFSTTIGTSGGINEWMRITSTGNVGIGTTAPAHKLQVNGDAGGTGAWINDSYSGYKENFQDVAVLDKISQLNIQEWQYKAQHLASDTSRHLSPFADDFMAQFHLGQSDHTIQSLDVAGVALKGVQELNTKVNQVSTQISDQFATLNDAFYITITSETANLSQNRDIEASQNRDIAISASTINLNGNVLANGLNLNTAIAGITENQNKIVEQLTGQLDTTSLTVSEKIGIIGKNLDDLTNNQIKKIKQQIEDNTGNQSLLDARLGILETVLGVEGSNLNILGNVTANNLSLSGKLDVDSAVSGAFAVKVTPDKPKTIGEVYICPADDTAEKCANSFEGKSVKVETMAVSTSAKIFINFENNPKAYSWSEKDVTGGKFTINLDKVVTEPVKVNWWILEEK